MSLVYHIREQYPTPRSGSYGVAGATPYKPGEYCIGGAFCAFYELVNEMCLPDLFPSRYELAHALRQANPLLIYQAAYYANAIIDANDKGEFDEAWKALDLALDYGKE